jgi:His/Glu/Gln/Arg/opine family amino acid ABC transporter permease subunit
MAIYLGEGNDKVPTAWEAMLLPAVLRDAVTERFGVKPEQLSERMAVVLPTSRALGKIALFVMSVALFLIVRLCARKNRVHLALGIVGAVCKMSRSKPLRVLGNVYVEFIRGTPMLLQLSFFYLGIPMLYQMITGKYLEVNPLFMGILAIGINSGAYVAEILRGGIMSIDNGQFEAGRSLGFNYVQTMIYIIIPQVFKSVLPTLCNEFIVLLKETSIAGYVGVMDLTKAGDLIRGRTFSAFMPLIAVALIYLVLVVVLTALVGVLERSLRKNER